MNPMSWSGIVLVVNQRLFVELIKKRPDESYPVVSVRGANAELFGVVVLCVMLPKASWA